MKLSAVRLGLALGAFVAISGAQAVAGPEPAPAPQAACTGPVSPVKLYVNVTGVRSAGGLIAVTLYADNSSKFLAKKGSLYVGRVPAVAPATRVCIHVPTTGIYAIAVYHDADSNRKFNRSGLGTPAEGYGFSNNPPTLFGLPAFSKVRIGVQRTDTQTTVRMKYP
ncbi:MAG: DUF2141 domain-containing protein [Pseudomonadota bacterium]